nr:hypothetical protein [Mycobacterium intermedium]
MTSSEGVTRIRVVADLVVLTDGEQHSRLRKQVQPAFTKGALDSWRDIIDRLAAELVDDMIASRGCDAVERLTTPMPLRVIAAILGVPESDIADFRRWSDESTQIINFTPTVKGFRRHNAIPAGRSGSAPLFLETTRGRASQRLGHRPRPLIGAQLRWCANRQPVVLHRHPAADRRQ